MAVSMERRAAVLASDGAWLLLAELNHRVHNELQVALSALRLARREAASAQSARFIEEAAARLDAVGRVQQLLDRQRGHGSMAERLEALCQATALAKAAPRSGRLTLKLDDVTADEETIWTVCVVACELMTNAFKHAFADGLAGEVVVVLTQDAQGVVLSVSDNGMGGAPGSFETAWEAPGFGTSIVSQLAERLGGFVTRVSAPGGTTATLSVPTANRP